MDLTWDCGCGRTNLDRHPECQLCGTPTGEKFQEPDFRNPWDFYLERFGRLVERYDVDHPPPMHSRSRILSLTLEEVEEQLHGVEDRIREALALPPLYRDSLGTRYEPEAA